MRREKRIRLFSGLLCPPGTGVARPMGSVLPGKVMLAGGDDAIALSPTLRKFAADSEVTLIEEMVFGSTWVDWAQNNWLDEAILYHRPDVTIALLPPRNGEDATVTVWMAPQGFSVVELPPRSIHGWTPSARGYAAWAAAAWMSATG